MGANHNKYQILIFLGVFICFVFLTHAQDRGLEDLKAQVLDESSKTPVVFATIKFKNSKKGVIADENGYFRFPQRYKELVDTLQINSIGYSIKEIPVAKLEDGRINTIFLSPKTEELDEVVLLGDGKLRRYRDSGKSLVRKAIANITYNYPTLPHSYIGYYRDYQMAENQYLNLNEAIVEVFDGGIQTNKINDRHNQTALHMYEVNPDFPQDEHLSKAYNKGRKYIQDAVISSMGGNELSILNLHDPIRNYNRLSFSFIDVFQKDFIKNHQFMATRISYLNDQPLYEVTFQYVGPSSKQVYAVRGKIYISPSNYAIHRLEYYLKYRGKPLYNLRVEYIPKGAHMYLNYISFNNFFKVTKSHDFDIQEVTFDLDQNSFLVKLTSPIKTSSLKNIGNFKFLYKKKELDIETIYVMNPKLLRIELVDDALLEDKTEDEEKVETEVEIIEDGDDIMKNVTYKIRNLIDIKNRKLGKKQNVIANQFRELFVQEVFPVKPLPQNSVFINKNRPLKNAPLDGSLKSEMYWINSPLKSITEPWPKISKN